MCCVYVHPEFLIHAKVITLFDKENVKCDRKNITEISMINFSKYNYRFEISDGNVTYQRRFVQTESYKKNKAAQRIVVSEFGTKAVPDPCQSIFKRYIYNNNNKITSTI